MINLARVFILIGVSFIILGGLVYFVARSGFSFGKIPGNIRIDMGNATCVIALGASILLSIILTVILNVVMRILNR